jgi:hypothetical protein
VSPTGPSPKDLLYSVIAFFYGLFGVIGLILVYIMRAGRRAVASSDQQLALDAKHRRLDTDTLYRLTLQEIRAARFPTPEQFLTGFTDRLIQETTEEETAPYSIGLPFFKAAIALYNHEGFSHVPAPTTETGEIQQARYRDGLLDLHKKLADPDQTVRVITDALVRSAKNFFAALPPIAMTDAEDSGMQLPLLDVVPDVKKAIISIITPFYSTQAIELDLFTDLRKQLEANEAGVDDKETDPQAIAYACLKGTPLEGLFNSTVPFELPDETRFAGHWIIAPPGRGKTTLLHAMVTGDLARDAAIVLIDSKGDLIEPLKRLRAIQDRLLLIEPNPNAAFALNPLDISHTSVAQAVSLIEYIMAGLLDAEFTALQSTLFRNVVPAIIEAIPNPTLDTFKEVMVRGLPNLDKLNPHARQFFENRETGFNSKTYDATRKQVVWRLDYLLTNPLMRSMFSATHTRIDLGKQIDAGKVIIINNSKAILGDEGAEFLGRFFVALIARAAQQRAGRPAAAKKPCYVYIDECQSVIAKDTRIPVLLDECRSQRIALILAHQRTAQLTPPVLDAVANCAIRMANSDDEAKYLSSKLRMDADVLRSLPRGTFGAFVRDLTPHGIQLKVSKVDLDALPKMTSAEFDAIRARMKTDFASNPPSAPDTLQPAARAPQRPTIKPAPTSRPTTPEAETPGAADPGEPADNW